MWNLLLGVTLVVCAFAFAAHYKNWVSLEGDHIRVLSGIYYLKVPYSMVNSVEMVDRIPGMKRRNGFSAWSMEKGIFIDSLHGNAPVYVYADKLEDPKIRLVHHDSLQLFLNLSDSRREQGIKLV